MAPFVVVVGGPLEILFQQTEADPDFDSHSHSHSVNQPQQTMVMSKVVAVIVHNGNRKWKIGLRGETDFSQPDGNKKKKNLASFRLCDVEAPEVLIGNRDEWRGKFSQIHMRSTVYLSFPACQGNLSSQPAKKRLAS